MSEKARKALLTSKDPMLDCVTNRVADALLAALRAAGLLIIDTATHVAVPMGADDADGMYAVYAAARRTAEENRG